MPSISVIRSRLIASENILCYLWQLMAQPYSELVKDLLEYIANHPDFPAWLQQFRLPDALIKDFVKTHKTQSPCKDLPGRFRDSAVILVKNIYASWFAIQKQKLLSLRGKKRFLSMLKSDEEILLESGADLYYITQQAQKLLKAIEDELETKWQLEGTKPLDEQAIFWQITNQLYDLHHQTKSLKKRCLIAYLIKNGNQIPKYPEDPEAYQLRRKNKEIQIQRLEEQIQGSAPQPKLMDDNKWLEVLNQAVKAITEVQDLEQLQRQLLQKVQILPYPVFYGTNVDLSWSMNNQGRICVSFNGLKKQGIMLEIGCNKRQLPYFQRFLGEINDYQLFQRYLLKKQANKHERHKAQKQFADNQWGEANAGLYFNRLFAHSIIEVAQTYQVSLIVLPDLKNIRELIEAEVKARAELKYPGNKTQQKRYAKDFRSTVNQWSYRQLSQCITNTALKTGIEIVTHRQTTKGSPQQKARQIALHFWEKQL